MPLPAPPTTLSRLTAHLTRPIDGASLAVFRIAFGLMMCAGITRFVASGWIETLFIKPTYFFKYPGFEWVAVPPPWALYLLYGALAVLALMVAAGLFYRVSIALFTAGFAYAQLLDVSNYLNHYYLIVLVGLLMTLLPLHRQWSLDAWRRPSLRRAHAPAWVLALLRFQVALVYLFAGLAKVNSDWLLHAQPLNIWLAARTETPIIGGLLGEPWVAYAMSWAGCLYDLTIVLWLSMRRTRPFAYAVVLVFHGLTHLFFDIGMFPVIMPVVTLLFFRPDWPRRVARWLGDRSAALRARLADIARAPEAPTRWHAPTRLSRAGLLVLGVYALVQLCLPLRFIAYGGNVSWHEQGMRYSWRVMLREKNGSITYRVRLRGGREVQVTPHRYLTWRQANEMSSQPDLIVSLAKHIAGEFARGGFGEVQVRCDAWVSLNGRAPARMIDPRVDLARVADGISKAHWILPAPRSVPIRLAARR